MVQRVNFIEAGPFALTYRNMILIVAAWAIFCFIVHGGFILTHSFYKYKVKEANKAIQELSAQKQKVLAMVQAVEGKQASSTVTQTLSSIFEKMPVWSSALSDVANKLPKQIWLDSLKSENTGDQNTMKRVEMRGKGYGTNSIAQFVKELENSDVFQNVILESSKKEGASFAFVVRAEVLFQKVGW